MAGRSEDDAEEFASDPDGDASESAGVETAGGGGGDGSARDGDTSDEADDWRFGVEEVGEEGVVQSAIEVEEPTLEHAVFVVLGALAMVLVFVHLWTLV
jgi:hypothetical protein